MSEFNYISNYPHKPTNLKGKVSSITTFKNGVIRGSDYYSKDGIETKSILYENGLLEKVWELVPDGENFITIEHSKDLKTSKIVKKLDSKYNLIWDEGNNTYEYNEHNLLLVQTEFSEQGTIDEKSIFHYDVHGQVILIERFDGNNTLVDRKIQKYGIHGIVSWEIEESNGEIYDRCYYYYDSKGYLVNEEQFDHDGPYSITVYEYNNDGKKILERFYDEKDGGGCNTMYEYDQQGRLTKEITPGSFEITYTYENDNVVQESLKDLQDGESWSKTTTYAITYFD